MPKYLVAASYTAEGIRGVVKDKPSGRAKAVAQALESIGGKLEQMYFALGEDDVYVLCDCPDNVTVMRLGLVVCGTGLARTRTIPLLTIDEMDKAVAQEVVYRGPGAP